MCKIFEAKTVVKFGSKLRGIFAKNLKVLERAGVSAPGLQREFFQGV